MRKEGVQVNYQDEEIRDTGPDGTSYVAAVRGDRGEIISVTDHPMWVDVLFERTGAIQTCHLSELRLCD